MGIKIIDELGHLIEEQWRETGYDPHRLPNIAEPLLRKAQLPEHLAPDDVAAWTLAAPELPLQHDAGGRFGQPPITIFRASRFFIEALHWIDGSTTIHQHGFSGAFQVLAGSSIETRYMFDVERTFDRHFVLGKLSLESSTFHGPGDVTAIRSGPKGLIHGLFHLERPSITIVVRTFADADAGPQFNFTRNGIGADPFFEENSRDRALQVISLLRKIEHPKLEQWVGDLIARSDFHTAYRVLEACATHTDLALFDRLVDRVTDRTVAEGFRDAFRESRRIAFLYSRRAHVRDPGQRFFLGVLLNARRRRDALDLVAARTLGIDPAQQAAAWLRELSRVGLKLQAAGTPWEPNVLGIPEMTDTLEQAFARELRGEAAGDDRPTLEFLNKLRALPALSCLFA
jgi:hypothetical protein